MNTVDPYLVHLFAEAERIVAETLPKLEELRRESETKKVVKSKDPPDGGRSPPREQASSVPASPPTMRQKPSSSRGRSLTPPSGGSWLPSPPLPSGMDWKGATIFVMSILIIVLLITLMVRG